MTFPGLFSTTSSGLTLIYLLSAGCASLTPTKETIEGHKIYDIQTAPSPAATLTLSANLKAALQARAGDIQVNNAIPPSALPDKPGRYALVNPFKGADGLMALAANNPAATIPGCDGAVMEAMSRGFFGSENTLFFVCLLPYQGGQQLDVYYRFSKLSGGYSGQALGVALAQSVLGDSGQFIR